MGSDPNDNGQDKQETAARITARALRYAQIAQQFRDLGIARFDAKLPEGRITWLDGDGRMVAAGRCSAILSYASANDSVMWAEGIPSFVEAEVPTVPRPEGMEIFMEGVDRDHAEHLANDAAGRAGADFYYAAPFGEGSTLFLAIFEFTAAEA